VVGKARELPPGLSRSLWVAGRRIALFNQNGELFAADAACPHMGADLGNGSVSGDTLTCAWHQWRFHLRTGEGLTRPWARLKLHRLVREGDDLVLELCDAPPPGDAREGDGTDP
jgi:nitrite reductase (NADH) small subunit/3-phenylpropionate/trans-cinnamate dioxygenase ferredoxin subunit